MKPPADAAVALAKKTHWRVYKKPPTVDELVGEPIGVVLTALVSSETRALVVKVGAGQWLDVRGTTYAECVERWRAAATSDAVDDAGIGAVIPIALYAWCVNRMYAVASSSAAGHKQPVALRGSQANTSKAAAPRKSKARSSGKQQGAGQTLTTVAPQKSRASSSGKQVAGQTLKPVAPRKSKASSSGKQVARQILKPAASSSGKPPAGQTLTTVAPRKSKASSSGKPVTPRLAGKSAKSRASIAAATKRAR